MNEERRSRNQQIIDDFRARGGVVGGMFDGIPLLLLHNTGAKSGAAHITPLAYIRDGEDWVVFAANGGRPAHPGWYYNLRANPAVEIEVGSGAHKATARLTEGDEREALRLRIREESPYYPGFEDATDREIPIFVLERTGA